MKVGLLESPAARLRAYWAAYLKELGVELARPALDDAGALDLGAQSLPGEASTVQLALGRILALGRVDTVLVPRWAPVSGDAWGEALTELLSRRISGLPTLVALPDDGDPESAAAELGVRLSPGAGGVRRALERVRPQVAGPRADMPLLGRAGRATVGVIGPRHLLAEPLLSGGLRPALEALGLHPVFSHDLPPAEVRRRAERLEDAGAVPAGERELFGAASLLAGKGAVRGLIYVSPLHDGATEQALRKLAGRLHKPALHLSVSPGQADFPELEAFRDQITLGAVSASAEAGEHA